MLKVLGTTDYDLLLDFFDALIEKNIGKILELINQIDSSGKNLAVFAKDIAKHSRELLTIKTCKQPNDILNLPEDVFVRFEEQAKKVGEKELIKCMQCFAGAENELRYTLSVRLLLETTALSVINNEDVKKN